MFANKEKSGVAEKTEKAQSGLWENVKVIIQALLLADRIAVMRAGRLVAQGTAKELTALDDSYVSDLLRTPRRQAQRLQAAFATDAP